VSRQLLLPSSGAERVALAVDIHHDTSAHARLPQQCGDACWPGTSSPGAEVLPSPLILFAATSHRSPELGGAVFLENTRETESWWWEPDRRAAPLHGHSSTQLCPGLASSWESYSVASLSLEATGVNSLSWDCYGHQFSWDCYRHCFLQRTRLSRWGKPWLDGGHRHLTPRGVPAMLGEGPRCPGLSLPARRCLHERAHSPG